MREKILLNQGTVTVEVHTQLRNTLSNREIKTAIINHPLTHTTLMISIISVTVGNQIPTSGVDWMII